MDREEIYEILERYDHNLYEYYMINAAYMGVGARWYAEKLKKEHEQEEK